MVTMIPSSSILADSIAAKAAAPEDIPTNNPSSHASRRVISRAASVRTGKWISGRFSL